MGAMTLHPLLRLVLFLGLAAASQGQCMYVATLSFSLTAGNVATSGSVAALSQASGAQVATFPSAPFAVAVDPVSATLFVSTITSIEQYEIADNLSSGTSTCPCSFTSVGNASVPQAMAVDQAGENLYFAQGSTICARLVKSGDIVCSTYQLPQSDSFGLLHIPPQSTILYATAKSSPTVYVVNLVQNDSYMQVVGTWTPLTVSSGIFAGMSIGPTGNMFLVAPVSANQSCAVIEVDINNGSLVSCFHPTPEEQSLFANIFGLVYDSLHGFFYSYFPSNGTTTTYNIQQYDLVESGAGQLANTQVYLLAEGVANPVDFALGQCPKAAASPTPQAPSSSSGVNVVSIVVPVVLGSVLLLLVALLIVAGLIWMYAKRHRKYFDSADLIEDAEAGTPMKESKFTFREIDGKDLRVGKLLAEGAFGKVYKGEYRGAEVAVKMFEALRLDKADDKVINELRMEAQMMERLSNHPNIVKFVGAITKGDEGASFALVTEFCPRGSLYDLLVKKKKKLPLITLVRMARDIASGILHLHKEMIVHRDIAARNVLVGQNYEVYVADFGLARAQAAEVATTKQNFGPIAWMAPEALKSRQYSQATDAFSFGILLWEMTVKKRPWAGEEPAQIIKAVMSNTRLKIPKDCDPMFAQIMKLCWRANSAQRPTFDKVAHMLSSYYKQLHKLQDFSENSDQDILDDSEEDEVPGSDEGLVYEEWQKRRIKDEVKSFMKQLLSERNDDLELIEQAHLDAFVELKQARKRDASEEDDDNNSEEVSSDSNNTPRDEYYRVPNKPESKEKLKEVMYTTTEALVPEGGENGVYVVAEELVPEAG